LCVAEKNRDADQTTERIKGDGLKEKFRAQGSKTITQAVAPGGGGLGEGGTSRNEIQDIRVNKLSLIHVTYDGRKKKGKKAGQQGPYRVSGRNQKANELFWRRGERQALKLEPEESAERSHERRRWGKDKFQWDGEYTQKKEVSTPIASGNKGKRSRAPNDGELQSKIKKGRLLHKLSEETSKRAPSTNKGSVAAWQGEKDPAPENHST